jgi:hypothetical protein
MPELTPQSIASSSPPPFPIFPTDPVGTTLPPIPPGTLPPSWPPAGPPTINPAAWEDYHVFRETFLLYVSEPEFNAALRRVGDYFFGMLLECCPDWPEWPESSTRTEARALVADLRHLQGFAATMGQEHHVSSLTPEDAKLSKHAAKVARLLKQVADAFEHKLAAGAA